MGQGEIQPTVVEDAAKHLWTFRLNVAKLEKIREEQGINFLGKPEDIPGEFEKMASDRGRRLIGTAYIILEEQAKEAGLNPEQFAERFGPWAVSERTISAIAFALESFIHPLIARAIKRLVTAGEAMNSPDEMAKVEQAVDEAIDKAISQMRFTGSLESSASTPDP